MRSRTGQFLVVLALAVVGQAMSAWMATTAYGASHLWVIHEVFSTADGTVQFIELQECCGADAETDLEGLWIHAVAHVSYFFFPADLPTGTANRSLLLATPGFAALPGAPVPDYIIEDNFFDTVSDVLSYYFFPTAEFQFGGGQLPLDGIHSLARDGTVSVNSPTNFAGATGSIVVGCEFVRGNVNLDGSVDVADAVYLLAALFSGGPSPVPTVAGDVNADSATNVADVVYLLGHLFAGGLAPPAPYPDPGC
ncbi:MAG: dockerin type I repeat-containing protein [Planctomycetota bacterium]